MALCPYSTDAIHDPFHFERGALKHDGRATRDARSNFVARLNKRACAILGDDISRTRDQNIGKMINYTPDLYLTIN